MQGPFNLREPQWTVSGRISRIPRSILSPRGDKIFIYYSIFSIR